MLRYRAYFTDRGESDAPTAIHIWTQIGECAEKAGHYKEARAAYDNSRRR